MGERGMSVLAGAVFLMVAGSGAAAKEPGSLEDVSRRMEEVKEVHLDHVETGPIVQKKIERILEELDRMIDVLKPAVPSPQDENGEETPPVGERPGFRPTPGKPVPGNEPVLTGRLPTADSALRQVPPGDLARNRLRLSGTWEVQFPERERVELLHRAGAEGFPSEYTYYLKRYYAQ